MEANSEKVNYKELLKDGLVELRSLQRKINSINDERTEPIAIVGMACRLPGGGNNAESFWKMLSEGVNANSEIPPERWNIEGYYDPDYEAKNKIYTRSGYFIENIDHFDPFFYGISPREATTMDPQQRILLDVALEAFENAGIPVNSLAGSNTGVFIGVSSNDFASVNRKNGSINGTYFATGSALSVTSGRLSYVLELQGPSITIDTACSSSLVTVHLACQSLRNKESDIGLAAGVNIMLSPDTMIILSKSKMLSPDGKCKSFDAAADGYGRGEGCGAIILKRLSDAERDNDNILAVIRGSAVNQDGSSAGLTAPNGLSQQDVILQSLKNAGLSPSDISYIEAHGTGTPLGDPIEFKAIGSVYCKDRLPGSVLHVGSVKSNIGHLESAAGISGLIKVLLCLKHKMILPNLHFDNPNPHINWDKYPIEIPTRLLNWDPPGKRIAGISSFGFSGTNAHVIIEEYVSAVSVQGSLGSDAARDELLFLSAKSEHSLDLLKSRYLAYLDSDSSDNFSDICATSLLGRSHFGYRLIVQGKSKEELVNNLRLCKERRGIAGRESNRVAFLFTGQGSQYVGMCKDLYDSEPCFRNAIEECAELLRPYVDKPLTEILYSVDSKDLIDHTMYTQPALFSVEYALAQLWISWGIKPSVLIGHSVGEYVAACIGGVFSLSDGLRLISLRGRLMGSLPAAGGMLNVYCDAEKIKSFLLPFEDLCLGAINSVRQVVVSGSLLSIDKLILLLEMEGIHSQKLKVSHAFHSDLMMPVLESFISEANKINYTIPRIDIISNVTGDVVSEELTGGAYWGKHIVSCVDFYSGLKKLAGYNCDVYIEIGPKATLLGLVRESDINIDNDSLLYSINPKESNRFSMLKALGSCYLKGFDINRSGYLGDRCWNKVVLPNYAFDQKRYWIDEDNRLGSSSSSFLLTGNMHPLLGNRLNLAGGEIIFMSQVSSFPDYLNDHKVFDKIIFPASAFIEMSLAGGKEILGTSHLLLENMIIYQAFVIEDIVSSSVQVQSVYHKVDKGRYCFRILSSKVNEAGELKWTEHFSGEIQKGVKERNRHDLPSLQQRYIDIVSRDDLYDSFQSRNICYGDDFKTISELRYKENSGLGLVRTMLSVSPYEFHPVLLDGCFQVLAGVLQSDSVTTGTYLPVKIGRLEYYGFSSSEMWSHIDISRVDSATLGADIEILSLQGEQVCRIHDFQAKHVIEGAFKEKGSNTGASSVLTDWIYELNWEPSPLKDLPALKQFTGRWVIFSDRQAIGSSLSKHLDENGASCIVVSPAKAYKASGPFHYELEIGDRQGYSQLFKDILSSGEGIKGIIYLWGTDISVTGSTAGTSLLESGTSALLYMLQSMSTYDELKYAFLYIVSLGSQGGVSESVINVGLFQSPLWGMSKSIRLEYPDLNCISIDLDAQDVSNGWRHIENEILGDTSEREIAYRQGIRYVSRLVKSTSVEIPVSESYELHLTEKGSIDGLELHTSDRKAPGSDEVEVRVRATGLNFRDVLLVLGSPVGNLLTDILGGEFSGEVVRVGSLVSQYKVGDEVISFSPGSFKKYITLKSDLVLAKPLNLSHQEGASIPGNFLTAYYILHHEIKIKKGDKILIHSAAGGTGLALIQLAKQAGAYVMGTASPWKWEYLRSCGVKDIFSSRTLDFVEQIQRITQGEGVDIVVNSLTGGFIVGGMNVLRKGGKFIEIGKAEILSEEQVNAIRDDIEYRYVDLVEVNKVFPGLIISILKELLEQFAQGDLRPLPIQSYPITQVQQAFRFMQHARHIGKIVLTHREQSAIAGVSSNNTYLITGGTRGLGLLSGQWLVTQGARHLLLVGRSKPGSAEMLQIKEMELKGVSVTIQEGDVSDENRLSEIIESIDVEYPLKGIIHSAGVLADGMLVNQSEEQFLKVMYPKVTGSWNLHKLSEGKGLDFFILYSSAASLLGSAGQSNYCSANSFLDSLAYYRRSLGLAATVINWGAWSEIGLAAGLQNRKKVLSVKGIDFISPKEGMEALGHVLKKSYIQVGVIPIDWSRFEIDRSNHFYERISTAQSNGKRNEGILFIKELQSLAKQDQRGALEVYILKQIGSVLGINEYRELDVEKGFFDLGMDSLTLMELRNILQKNLECSLPADIIFDYPTPQKLIKHITSEILIMDEQNKS